MLHRCERKYLVTINYTIKFLLFSHISLYNSSIQKFLINVSINIKWMNSDETTYGAKSSDLFSSAWLTSCVKKSWLANHRKILCLGNFEWHIELWDKNCWTSSQSAIWRYSYLAIGCGLNAVSLLQPLV